MDRPPAIGACSMLTWFDSRDVQKVLILSGIRWPERTGASLIKLHDLESTSWWKQCLNPSSLVTDLLD